MHVLLKIKYEDTASIPFPRVCFTVFLKFFLETTNP